MAGAFVTETTEKREITQEKHGVHVVFEHLKVNPIQIGAEKLEISQITVHSAFIISRLKIRVSV